MEMVAQTLVGMLERRAELTPERLVYRFLKDDETEPHQVLTYGELDRHARAIASAMEQTGVEGPAVLLYPPGLDFLAAFFGCLYTGVPAIPAYPPGRRTAARLRAILADSGAGAILTTERARSRLGAATGC